MIVSSLPSSSRPRRSHIAKDSSASSSITCCESLAPASTSSRPQSPWTWCQPVQAIAIAPSKEEILRQPSSHQPRKSLKVASSTRTRGVLNRSPLKTDPSFHNRYSLKITTRACMTTVSTYLLMTRASIARIPTNKRRHPSTTLT